MLAQKQRMRVMEIYGSPSQAKKFQPPHPKPMYRPAHFKFIVPAAGEQSSDNRVFSYFCHCSGVSSPDDAVMSYNFAVGSYVKQSDYAMLRRRKLRTAVTRYFVTSQRVIKIEVSGKLNFLSFSSLYYFNFI